MKIAIIVFIVLSLLGSVMWVMPTRRERFQAKLRLKARTEGFQVQLVHLEGPREQGEMEPTTQNVPAYRLMRLGLRKEEAAEITPWQVFKANALANEGLPAGWSWKRGERQLEDRALARLSLVIEQMPEDIVAIESTPVQVSAYWREGQEDDMATIKAALNQLLEARI